MTKTNRQTPVQNPQIGANLRRLRQEQGLSIRQFCQKVEPPISPVQLLSTELGRREPSIAMVNRYAAALGVELADLLESNGAPVPVPAKSRRPAARKLNTTKKPPRRRRATDAGADLAQ